MKKTVWLLSGLILVVLLGVICLRPHKVNMDFVQSAKVCFQYENADVTCQLSDDEMEFIKTIFNGKKMYKDNLSCGFSETVSVTFNNEQTFCIARDNCPIVYWKEKNKYIKLTENEKEQLYTLLEPYGFSFPCI